MISANPTTSSGPMGSPNAIAPHRIANAGTMKVTVLAAVADVRLSTRKYSGQASAVDTTATASNDAAPAADGTPGGPDRTANGSRTIEADTSWPVAISMPGIPLRRRRTKVPATP